MKHDKIIPKNQPICFSTLSSKRKTIALCIFHNVSNNVTINDVHEYFDDNWAPLTCRSGNGTRIEPWIFFIRNIVSLSRNNVWSDSPHHLQFCALKIEFVTAILCWNSLVPENLVIAIIKQLFCKLMKWNFIDAVFSTKKGREEKKSFSKFRSELKRNADWGSHRVNENFVFIFRVRMFAKLKNIHCWLNHP